MRVGKPTNDLSVKARVEHYESDLRNRGRDPRNASRVLFHLAGTRLANKLVMASSLSADLSEFRDHLVAKGLKPWRQIVRALRNGTLIATGERSERELWRDADRREIGSDTWLRDDVWGDLWFDVRTNRICAVTGDSYDRKKIPRWFDVQMRRADEAAEFESFEKELSEKGKSGDKALAPPQPDKKLKKQIRVLEAMKELIKNEPAAAGLSNEAMSDRLAARMMEKVSPKIVATVRKFLPTSELPKNFRETSD